MKRTIGILTATMALLFLLSACSGASIEEKKAQFRQKTLTPLQEMGYQLAQKEEGEQKSRYLLRLGKGEKVASSLLQEALGSSNPQWSRELARGLAGSGLELTVDWERYAAAKPGSVTAVLLPREGATGSAPIVRLLQAKKLRADLEFDPAGALTQIRFQPLDETVEQNGSRYHLVMEGTGIKRTGPGAYLLTNDRLALTGTGGEATVRMESRGLRCDVALSDALFGKRHCRLDSVLLETESSLKGKGMKDRILLENLEGSTEVRAGKEGVRSDGKLTVGRFDLQGTHPGERVDLQGRALGLQGDASRVPESLYRQMMALLAAPPAKPEAVAQALAPLLEKLFRQLNLHYDVTLGELNATVRTADGNDVRLGLQGYRFGLGAAFAADLNLSKRFEIRRLTLQESRGKKKVLSLDLQGFSLGVQARELYNLMPELMGLALESTRATTPAQTQALERQAAALGARLLQRGIHLQVAPLTFEALDLSDTTRHKRLGAVEAELDVRLKPNRLDPANPMAMLMALAYLQADGKVVLKRKDLEQILPELDPTVAATVRQYVRYEGDRALFTLRFDQGNLLVNGKPLR
jgi:hypothetical protein